jgi:hypothetical protein
MKTLLAGLAVVFALALLTPTPELFAQGAPPTLLNEVEVRQLIERAEPADHARLSVHFTVLAQRYEADARRHEAMGRSFSGNPKLAAMASSQREHCRQLSARNLESATTLRELAAHHTKLAAGVISDAPKGWEGFERGSGTPPASDQDLTRLAAEAETAADHRALEDYFTTLAARYDQDAKRSATYAASWRSAGSRNPGAALLATHWDRLARQQRASATEARAAAALHKAQATTVREGL